MSMTPTNQPTESKGDELCIRPSTGKFTNLCGVVWCEPEPGSEMKIAVFSNEHVGEDEAVDNAELCTDAFETYTRAGLTPRQLAERVKELEARHTLHMEAVPYMREERDQLAERVKELEAKLTTLIEDVNYEGGCAYWQKKHLDVLKQNLELADQLAASEAAREAKDRALSAVLECEIITGMSAGIRDHAKRVGNPNPLILAKQALAQQPAECLAKREQERFTVIPLEKLHEDFPPMAGELCDQGLRVTWMTLAQAFEKWCNQIIETQQKLVAERNIRAADQETARLRERVAELEAVLVLLEKGEGGSLLARIYDARQAIASVSGRKEEA